MEEIYSFLGLKASFHKNKLIFIVLIPFLEKAKYYHFLLDSLPVGNTTLKLPSHEAITNSQKTFFVINCCQRIHTKTLCTIDDLLDVTNDNCFSKLLRGLPASCPFLFHPVKPEVKMLTGNHVIIKGVKNLTIDTTCNVPKRNLTGTYLLEFHNCTLYVNGTKFTNSEIVKSESPVIVPLNGIIVERQKVETPLKLEEVHVANRMQMEIFSHKLKTQTYTSISISSFTIIVTLIVFLLIIKRRQINIKISKTSMDNGNTATTNRDDSLSQEGVVKSTGTDFLIEDLRRKHEAVQKQLHDFIQQQQQP